MLGSVGRWKPEEGGGGEAGSDGGGPSMDGRGEEGRATEAGSGGGGAGGGVGSGVDVGGCNAFFALAAALSLSDRERGGMGGVELNSK